MCLLGLFRQEADVSSVVETLVAVDEALGGYEGGDVLRVVAELTGQRFFALAEGGAEEGVAVGSQDDFWAVCLLALDHLHSGAVDGESVNHGVLSVLSGEHGFD